MKPVKVDRCQNVGNVRRGNVELCQQFDFSAGNAGIYMQLSRDGNEIFLQHLKGYHAGPGPPVLGHKFYRSLLLGGRRLVVGIDENVGVEKATNAHESRHAGSASRESVLDRRGA